MKGTEYDRLLTATFSGAKAGTERYEQLRRLYDNLLDSPQVRACDGRAKDAASLRYEQAKDKASEGVFQGQRDVQEKCSATVNKLVSRWRCPHALKVSTLQSQLLTLRMPQLRQRLGLDSTSPPRDPEFLEAAYITRVMTFWKPRPQQP